MFRDERRRTVWDEIRQHDIRAFSDRLTTEVIHEAADRVGVRTGAGPLRLVNLVWLAIASALHYTKNFADILTLTMKLLEDQPSFGSSPLGRAKKAGKRRKTPKRRSKHDPRRRDPTIVSEEAFTKARRRLLVSFWTELILLLGARIQREHGRRLRWKGFRLLALDGSVVGLPHWKRLRQHYGTAGNRRRACRTQARMVMLQFPLARLPYCHAVAPLASGEIPMARSLFRHLEPDDLLLMDRGFFSYGVFWDIQQRGAFFAIRLKARIHLKTIRRLGPQDRLVRWAPRDWRKKWRELPRSITLRVIRYQFAGFRASAVVTNLTDPKRITREHWVGLTKDRDVGRNLQPGLYHRRWEIETTFRELKVVQGLKGHLRSRSPEGIEYEIAGHVLLYLLVRWAMLEAAVRHGIDPLRLSFIEALRELEDIRPALLVASPRWARVLISRLLQRIASHTVPVRPGRSYPRPNDGKTKNKGNGRKQLAAKLAA